MIARLLLRRGAATPNSTPGRLTLLDGRGEVVFACDTLELPWRDNARRVSCIPSGKYSLARRRRGGYFERYNKRHGHPCVFEVARVAGRSDILIHIGNYPRNTLGCLLVGKKVAGRADFVGGSAAAYKKFFAACDRARPQTITITDAEEDDGN